MTVKRMDNVGIVVESLDTAIAFFSELGLNLQGRAMIEGEWAGRVTGLGNQRVEIAMMATPDGHGRLELSRFIDPPVVADHRNAPVNALGYLRVMFAVDDVDDTLARLREHGAELVGDVVQYEQSYRLCYVRGPKDCSSGSPRSFGSSSPAGRGRLSATRAALRGGADGRNADPPNGTGPTAMMPLGRRPSHEVRRNGRGAHQVLVRVHQRYDLLRTAPCAPGQPHAGADDRNRSICRICERLDRRSGCPSSSAFREIPPRFRLPESSRAASAAWG